jgi:hypothetical protein
MYCPSDPVFLLILVIADVTYHPASVTPVRPFRDPFAAPKRKEHFPTFAVVMKRPLSFSWISPFYSGRFGPEMSFILKRSVRKMTNRPQFMAWRLHV